MPSNVRKRRRVVQGLLGGGAYAAFPRVLQCQTPSAYLVPSALDEQLTLLAGAGGNIVILKGNQGLTLVDSGMREHIDAVLALVDQSSGGAPIRQLINTHWHEDHSGGNEALRARGARIFAHENTRLWLGADFDVNWRNYTHKPRPAEAMPDTTTYVSGQMDLDGEAVEYLHYGQAHTDGDLAVYFPARNVLIAGGLVSNYRYPICDIATGGWIGGLLNANKALLEKVDDATLIVPDRGGALRKADLQAQHDMLDDLYTKMKALAQEGHSGHDMLDVKVTAAYDERWGDPEEFVLETYRGMWAHTYDMGGFI